MGKDRLNWRLRTVVALSRPARLPTIWSNCLAGWWLGGAGNHEQLPFLFAGVTLLYLGTAFLNDAFDVSFDRQHQRQRPVPAGAIGLRSVWRWGLALLVGGTLLLFLAKPAPGALGLAIVVTAVLFNALHRLITFAPVLIGVCRVLLYLLGASVALHPVTGSALWCGLAAGAYATGQAYLGNWSVRSLPPHSWPVPLFGAPVALAVLMNAGSYREPALLLALALALWTFRSLRYTFWSPARNLSQTASLLLAGLIFVDWLACCNGPRELSFVFLALFLATATLQQIPSAR